MAEGGAARHEELPRIEVIMGDGTHRHYTSRLFAIMLDHNLVVKFKRAAGWVTIGVDPVRRKRRNGESSGYTGPERRRPANVRMRWLY